MDVRNNREYVDVDSDPAFTDFDLFLSTLSFFRIRLGYLGHDLKFNYLIESLTSLYKISMKSAPLISVIRYLGKIESTRDDNIPG